VAGEIAGGLASCVGVNTPVPRVDSVSICGRVPEFCSQEEVGKRCWRQDQRHAIRCQQCRKVLRRSSWPWHATERHALLPHSRSRMFSPASASAAAQCTAHGLFRAEQARSLTMGLTLAASDYVTGIIDVSRMPCTVCARPLTGSSELPGHGMMSGGQHIQTRGAGVSLRSLDDGYDPDAALRLARYGLL